MQRFLAQVCENKLDDVTIWVDYVFYTSAIDEVMVSSLACVHLILKLKRCSKTATFLIRMIAFFSFVMGQRPAITRSRISQASIVFYSFGLERGKRRKTIMGLSYFSISIQLLHIFQMGLQLQGFSLERVSSFNGPHVVISVEKVFRWPKATQILSKHKIVREPVKLIVIDNFFFQSCAPFLFSCFYKPQSYQIICHFPLQVLFPKIQTEIGPISGG